ncbi:MAG TPA: L,D-transpeptidase family protein [Hyphomicrobiaceae bacterium]|nr:L,D-transpeptidase family protein [Hyphomicrobiaceae bacterium]
MQVDRFCLAFLALVLSALTASAADEPGGPAAQAAQAAASAAPAEKAAEPSPQPAAPPAVAEAGLAAELTERLAAGSAASAADRADREALAAFYAARGYVPVWVTASGPTPGAQAAIAEIRRADDWGLEASAFQLPTLPAAGGAALSAAQRADAEVALSLAILKYARHARGSRADPATLSRNLDRQLPLLDPGEVIRAATKADQPDAFLRFLHPQHPQFEALRQKYLALRAGQTMPPAATAPAADDAKGKNAGKAKPVAAPSQASARKLLVNMEEWRWMPEDLGDFYVWVNIPEFTLRVVKNGEVIHTERVIVGKPDTPTPVLSKDMEQVIFHPFWGVPESIKQQDVLPSLRRGSTRLFTHYKLRIQKGGRDIDPETVDWSTADIRSFHVFQPPGETNVLGTVKFRFPNKHDVYMHDTPTKNLFNADVRAFSHGCMRVRNPQRLAELLLAEDKGWPASRVAAAMGPGGAHNNQVNIGRKIPVHITYFTARVEADGKLRLYADLYDHESKIALGLAGKAHLIPRWKEDRAPATAEPIARLEEVSSGGMGKKNWQRQVLSPFGNH